jgi:phosphopantothenoylcysteine decarboxylase/phosphopantothenate--cysteine ligase
MDGWAAAGGAAALRPGPRPEPLVRGGGPGRSNRGNDRPALVIGFAAETEKILANARAKREKKGCDWILANDVSSGTGTFGGDSNTIHLVDAAGVEDWPAMTKREVADRLALRIAAALGAHR